MRKETFNFIVKLAWIFLLSSIFTASAAAGSGIKFLIHIVYYFSIPLVVVLNILGLLFFWEIRKKPVPENPPLTWLEPDEEHPLYRSSNGQYIIEEEENVFKIYCSGVYLGFTITAVEALRKCEEHYQNPALDFMKEETAEEK